MLFINLGHLLFFQNSDKFYFFGIRKSVYFGKTALIYGYIKSPIKNMLFIGLRSKNVNEKLFRVHFFDGINSFYNIIHFNNFVVTFYDIVKSAIL